MPVKGTQGIKVRIIFIGVSLMALSWLADAAIDSLFEENSFVQNIFFPELHKGLIRGVFLGSQLGFLIYISVLFSRQRRLQDELRLSSQREAVERNKCEAILEALGDGISIQDRSWRILYQNALHRSMMGDHRGELCYRAYHGFGSVCPGCRLERSFNDGQVHVHESETRGPDGRQVVEIISTPLLDDDGRIVAGIEAVRDVTERKLLEERLYHQLAAIESSIDGIGILDQGARYTYLNQAHANLYGYEEPADLLGQSWRLLYEAAELTRFEEQVMPELFAAGRWRGEALGRRRDGSTFPQDLSLSVLEDGGIVCVVRDISRRIQALESLHQANQELAGRTGELETANRELEAFSYSLSHDLRSFLTRISAAAQLLEAGTPDPDQNQSHCLATILGACEGMEDLIQAMLVLAQVSRRPLQLEQVDLSQLALDILAGLRVTAPQRVVAIAVAEGLTAVADRQLLRVALANLLGNAWKFTAASGAARIEVGGGEMDGRRVFWVKDNGQGFDMAEAEKMFRPFQRLSNARQIPGTGIGLATVARVVQRHGGKVWAEGVPEKGASFYFSLS